MTEHFEKYVDLGGCSQAGEQDYTLVHSSTLEKVASECYTPQELLDVAKDLKPKENGIYVLLNALGAYESWGVNRNGDAFPEWSLKGEDPPESVVKLLKEKHGERGEKAHIPDKDQYGYKTFVSNAHVFPYHQNKDPKKAIGQVVAAAYNDKMRRVELIVFVEEDKAPDTVKQLRNGEPVPWSMGSRLPNDVCSVCGNIARRRADYCDHLKMFLRQDMGDGRKVFSYNFFPKFFDISRVRTPADPSAWTLRKIASAATEKEAAMIKKEVPAMQQTEIKPKQNSRAAELRKIALHDIQSQKSFSDKDLEQLKRHGLSKVASHCAVLGICLHNKEMESLGDMSDVTVEFNDFDRRLLDKLAAHLDERSMLSPYFEKRAKRKKNVTKSETGRDKDIDLYADLFDVPQARNATDAVEKNATVRFVLDPNVFDQLFIPTTTSEPKWLPFVAAITN